MFFQLNNIGSKVYYYKAVILIFLKKEGAVQLETC